MGARPPHGGRKVGARRCRDRVGFGRTPRRRVINGRLGEPSLPEAARSARSA